MKFPSLLIGLLILTFLGSANAQKIRSVKIRKLIENSEVLSKHFTGFMLYDPARRQVIAEQLSHKYFTPASNTKLFTFYGGLKILKDSLPGIQYVIKGDSLIFWSTADPTFLHPDFEEQKVRDFLLNSGKNLYWASGRYLGQFYGTGWSYDDYNDYYQPEISELPVFGNIIRVKAAGNLLSSSPPLPLEGIFSLTPDSIAVQKNFRLRREILSNAFKYPAMPFTSVYAQEIPFRTDDTTIDGILKTVFPNYRGRISAIKPATTQTIYSAMSDTVFKRMLRPSDNFIAEQLLLNYAAALERPMSTDSTISFILENYLNDLPDKVQWVDGSGLSRQNLFSPADMVMLCEMIYNEIGDEKRLFDLLPTGGQTGTLKNYFKSEEPFVFAKTGTLSNNHSLSGFLKTQSGKTLIFSFMNNNYVSSTTDLRKEMERILTLVHQRY